MKIDELNFIGNDPGAVKHGNFINYYSFHSAKERINMLNNQMFPAPPYSKEPILCMDIGCNTGELTKEIYEYLKIVYPDHSIQILALDIDQTLIKRAIETYNNTTDITFMALNVMTTEDQERINEFLKKFEKKTFDLTFCFSVTMWIHLNNGDEGLLKFLEFISNISRAIIIEPQPWNCYRSAQRRLKKSGSTFDLYEKLKIRKDVVLIIESTIQMNNHSKIYESANSTWKRKITSYKQGPFIA